MTEYTSKCTISLYSREVAWIIITTVWIFPKINRIIETIGRCGIGITGLNNCIIKVTNSRIEENMSQILKVIKVLDQQNVLYTEEE